MISVDARSAPKAPKIERISVKQWTAGTVTARDDGRTPIQGLRSSGNVYLDQDEIIRPRPSMNLYGPQPTGTVLGEIFEFTENTTPSTTYPDGKIKYLGCLQNVSGTTKFYYCKGEDTVWTAAAGKTFDNSASGHFCQPGKKVLIMNGTDNLSYFDIASKTVIPYTALTTPGAPTIANNGSTDLTSGTVPFTITYRITANSTVGETDASTSTSRTVNTDRDFWNPTTQSLKITWSAVPNAVSYNVYMGIVGGYEYLIRSGVNGLQYVDDGSAAQDTTHLYPTTNSTSGPKARRGSVINGRVFLVGTSGREYDIIYGGDPGFELDFTPVNGGGYTTVGYGTKELPVRVMQFRDGRGNAQITVLCQGTNGRGKRYLLTPDQITFGDQIFPFYDVTEDNGQDGTDSPDGIILYQDSLYYPSRDGFKTTGTRPQIQNLLSTDRISNTIQPDIKNLNNASMVNSVGIGFEGRLYWALPVGSTTNNEIWVLDLDRQGAWMKPWSISATWMALYNDNSGTTHFLVLSNNKIYELAYITFTSDNGTAVPTSGNSGQIRFSKDGREWGRLIQLIFVLSRPQGQINFSVSGKTEDSSLAVVGAETFISTSTVAGWSEPNKYIVGWGRWAWSKVGEVPATFNDATQEVIVEVDEELQWYSYGWTTNTVGVDYGLTDVIAEFVNVGIKDLS